MKYNTVLVLFVLLGMCLGFPLGSLYQQHKSDSEFKAKIEQTTDRVNLEIYQDESIGRHENSKNTIKEWSNYYLYEFSTYLKDNN